MDNTGIKVVLTGPECSGKSTMATILAKQLDWPVVAEYAREYLSKKPLQYNSNDLHAIARGQLDSEKNALLQDTPGIICDTDLLTIMIWHEVKFGGMILEDQITQVNSASMYFLCRPDFSYALDPMREDIRIQDVLFDLYLNRLIIMKLPFIILEGEIWKRKDRALKAIEQLLT